MNAEWHREHRLGQKASMDDRISWHLAHLKACSCRTDLPATVLAAMKDRGIAVPDEARTPEGS